MKHARDFRDALGRFPTGVALVTVMEEGRARAMTVNSFASVSLDPPLVLWSLARDSFRYTLFHDVERFAINVLAADQIHLSGECARQDDLDASGAKWEVGPGGSPLVEGAVARFECAREAIHEAGDHDVVIGRVTYFDTPRKAPALVFYRSGYSRPQED